MNLDCCAETNTEAREGRPAARDTCLKSVCAILSGSTQTIDQVEKCVFAYSTVVYSKTRRRRDEGDRAANASLGRDARIH